MIYHDAIDKMQELPKDIIRQAVCQYLFTYEQLLLGLTCKTFHEYIMDPIVFQNVQIFIPKTLHLPETNNNIWYYDDEIIHIPIELFSRTKNINIHCLKEFTMKKLLYELPQMVKIYHYCSVSNIKKHLYVLKDHQFTLIRKFPINVPEELVDYFGDYLRQNDFSMSP
jgi:hypothetical protein